VRSLNLGDLITTGPLTLPRRKERIHEIQARKRSPPLISVDFLCHQFVIKGGGGPVLISCVLESCQCMIGENCRADGDPRCIGMAGCAQASSNTPCWDPWRCAPACPTLCGNQVTYTPVLHPLRVVNATEMQTATERAFNGTNGGQMSFIGTDLPDVPVWHGNLTFNLLFEGSLQVSGPSVLHRVTSDHITIHACFVPLLSFHHHGVSPANLL
jgi:hypothetical protein